MKKETTDLNEPNQVDEDEISRDKRMKIGMYDY